MIRERFDRDGWALVQRFITPREVEALRSATDELASKGATRAVIIDDATESYTDRFSPPV